ncbi:hypothetical protein Skadi4_46 [Pelagibacter phage Skadi-4 EXVC104P]|nr:hypothetical protein Skadi5_24 [Pelagibacter phage Skadi-5 EXVC105P]UWJ03763.1 hypothetical protein Skadi6_13 [Pelagibacter phage Skadi-6 EXVC106P]UWJ03832.1 hypothetical protein Skadi10_24 [Pelagibacter phage Skadi-10 EXVC110P]UWJ03890.1 hypothetical protein Skadi8_24 [Pelagibacter phage Skadi-8 EXVC108P]UWJ03929.1 hypothetical protein Skadi3_5 [Pelagibacter phage Skadi-3 EXVC103P]UWJ04022.1 hypothetical protein Skadi2_25 [Pelagibacter phage Skadi-2 EXVC102P]UWJ04069.1 hypothetical protei
MNKQLTQKQNLKELMRLTLINILNAKGVIYTYYKQQQERENNVNRQAHNKDNWIKIRS